jgi:hypothetical protein
MRGAPRPDLRLHKRHVAKLDVDQRITPADHRIPHLLHSQHLRRPELLDHDRSHGEAAKLATPAIMPGETPGHNGQ